MSRFRTTVPQALSAWKISHRSHMLLMGSCFAERIGAKLHASKFPSQVNPLGIAYNPLSLARLLSFHAGITEESLAVNFAEHLGLWHSFDLHSSFSDPQREAFEQRVQVALSLARSAWKQTEILILTWGTAHAFYKRDTESVVNNCHKYPGSLFEQQRLSPDQIVSIYNPLLKQLFSLRPNLRVILTISPVRHIRLGIHENQLSKASLLLASEALTSQWEQVEYFPAYELLLDDLRDYRFYGDDLIHPSDLGVNYIWDHFAERYFSKETQALMSTWAKIQQGLAHKPLFPGSSSHISFLEKLQQKIIKINQSLDCTAELEVVSTRIAVAKS